MTLADVKAGDDVTVFNGDVVIRISKVEKVTAKQIHLGPRSIYWRVDVERGGHIKHTIKAGKDVDGSTSIRVPTAKDRNVIAERVRQRKAEEEKRAALEADPKFQLFRRLNTDPTFLPWDKCTLEELQTVCAIVDAANKRK